ncbi:zinc-type alcohol dehydrogenase-like protein AdhB [Penicillium maclennaniae]|uniref:zinc-type alcohol dehydrogenase-like protein AdhB n=1 Tax=Penicillium maclennaniae TaxID=1343394 RepID=UPI00253F8CEA|nr:zinc-type alcohol dehydrogenase-like protein AdhB [Penicillium maclennaniae]KAJ5668640.1 zinc-type alcohol dehydrogenase-like protein AdhB [Penicillium maclennaniae]
MPPNTMRAVVLKGDYKVEVEDRPYPKLFHSTDTILKVTSTALCGSDLHFYRGYLKAPPGFICGYEFVGDIVEKGDNMKNFNVGDKVVVPFYIACGDCYYYIRREASRCTKGELFGNSVPDNIIDGGQAKYIRCPLADITFVYALKDIPEEILVLIADIFPTGYFAVSRFLKDLEIRDRKNFTVACVGCGPVSIYAITCALTMVNKVYAIDTIPERLEQAAKIGAIPINLNDDPVQKIKDATDRRGADVVLEVVSHADGKISSVGLYGKNMTIEFRRCPVRSIFEDALAILIQEQKKLVFLCEKIIGLEEAPKAYKEFKSRKWHKIIFKIDSTTTGKIIEALI